MTHPLQDLVAARRRGEKIGITSVCSAHPLVIEAALSLAKDGDRPILIEATCNQVNQEGGYTGMTPADFRESVEGIATRIGFEAGRIILGGDHLGPNPWKGLPADEAMSRAEAMIAAYSTAGFTKLHLDTSMGCAGEPTALPDEATASRAARLATVAERHRGEEQPVYVIGTEVPVPGGAVEELDHVQVTEAAAVRQTYDVHRRAFEAAGASDAFGRVVALVVQPGVEFGHSEVIRYDRQAARALTASLDELPEVVFEAHSTDYQTADGLKALVEDGFAILKVGPWLTFALREALYGLDAVADVLNGRPPTGGLMATLEAVMREKPGNWQKYHGGDQTQVWLQRHFSLSDRIRYYWPEAPVAAAVAGLFDRIEGSSVPAPLARQYLPWLVADESAGELRLGQSSVISHVQSVLETYRRAEAP